MDTAYSPSAWRHHGTQSSSSPASAPELWPLVDYLTPNGVRAAQASGLPLAALSDAADVAQVLLARGPRVGHPYP